MKCELIEHAIGEVFEYNGMDLKVVVGTPCSGCVFCDSDSGCFDDEKVLVCNGGVRKDGKDVIFKAVEPETIEPVVKEAPEVDGTANWPKKIPASLYDRLDYLGIIPNEARAHNVGTSDYAKHTIQPWSIWLDYPDLTSWDHDIIKRVLRTKATEDRITDYQKIIHICQERIRQINKQKQL